MYEFKLPDLGEGIHEGELLKWHVKEGDSVKEDDPLCDVETDKAAVTIPSPRTGVVRQLNAQPGDVVSVGRILIVIEDGSAGDSPSPDLSTAEPVAASAPPGNAPRMHDYPPPIPPQNTPGPSAGRVVAAPAVRRMAREMKIDINTIAGTGPGGRVTRGDLEAHSPGGFQDLPQPEPMAPFMADVTLEDVPVEKEVKSTPRPSPPPTPSSTTAPPADMAASPSDTGGEMASHIPFFEVASLPAWAVAGDVERVPIRSLRRKTAIKTTSSSILVPHVAHMEDVDVTDLEVLRKTHNQIHGPEVKLTLLAFVMRAAAAMLKNYPEFNASVDTQSMEVVFKSFVHVGFAADTPRGLVVPVVRDTNRKNVKDIGKEIQSLVKRGRESSLTVEELTGGTFSVTNVGAIGGTRVFPIINHPETAIMGMGRVESKPVVREDEIQIRKILPLTLCFDHRVADGAQAATFVKEVKEILEDPVEFMIRG